MNKFTSKINSHLIHVDSIPDNSIQITNYGRYEFKDLFFCKSNNKLYQKFAYRIREIPLFDENGKRIRSYIRTKDKKSIPIAPRKLKKIIRSIENN